jgi:phenylacetate-CoA ligase
LSEDLLWSPLEAESTEALLGRQLELLNAQLGSLMERSAFYQHKLAAAGIGSGFRVKRFEDLAELPLTLKDELRHSLERRRPLGEHLACDPAEVIQVQATSGTTGSPSYVGLTAADCDVWSELGARALRAGGLGPGDVVLHCWSLSKGFTGGVPVVKMLQHLGTRVLPIGAEAGAQRLLTVLDQQAPSGVVGTPNFLTYLGDQAAGVLGRSLEGSTVEHLVVGGEPGGGIPSIRAYLQGSWGATCTEVLGNSDMAPLIWGECLDRSGMHFCGQALVLVELIDPTSLRHVEPVPGASGEIVYTALRRDASPLLRFRSGDRVEVLGTDCGCGRASYKIRCTGRTDDMLIVRGVNVWPTAVQEIVVAHRPAATGAMRILVDFEGHATNRPLQIQVERGNGLDPAGSEALAASVTEAIRSALVFTPSVEIVEPGSVEQPGAGKVRLVERVTPARSQG